MTNDEHIMMHQREQQEHTDSVMELKLITEKILEGQTKMQHDIHEIKMSLFDPDNGLYARVSRNSSFRIAASKWLWVLTTGLLITLVRELAKYVLK